MKDERGHDLGKTQIAPAVRVSSAAVFYGPQRWGGTYWQVETWIFSDDPAQRPRQIIHGTSTGDEPDPWLCAVAIDVHEKIAENLRRAFLAVSA